MEVRDRGKELVRGLVKMFSGDYVAYTRSSSSYNETLLRVDFLNPFLEALGWDVDNKKGAPQHLREVVHEDIVLIDDEKLVSKKPDYAFRLGIDRKFFLEANDFDSGAWRLIHPQLEDFFSRLQEQNQLRLDTAYDIFVGLQTSDDKIYIFAPTAVCY